MMQLVDKQTALYCVYKCSQLELNVVLQLLKKKACQVAAPPRHTITKHMYCIRDAAAAIDSHWHATQQTSACLFVWTDKCKLGVRSIRKI